jgi:hypothetical protein
MYYDHRVDINMNEYSWQIFSPRKKEKCFHGFAGEKCAQRDEKEKGEKDFEEKESQFFSGKNNSRQNLINLWGAVNFTLANM